MLDTTCVLKMPGAKVVAALENACSQYPALEGRFAQVSGLSYVFDAAKPPGQRVVSCEIPSGTPIDANRTYTVCTKEYLSLGKDGYDAFVGCETIRSGESRRFPTTLRNHLLTLDVLNAMGADEIEMRGDGDADESGDAAVVRRAMNAFKRGSDSAVASSRRRRENTRRAKEEASSRRRWRGRTQSRGNCAWRRASTGESSRETPWKTSGRDDEATIATKERSRGARRTRSVASRGRTRRWSIYLYSRAAVSSSLSRHYSSFSRAPRFRRLLRSRCICARFVLTISPVMITRKLTRTTTRTTSSGPEKIVVAKNPPSSK